MSYNPTKRKFLIVVLICLVISSELVHFIECDGSFIKIMKMAKKLKKVKKWLPLMLMGPKILVIKTTTGSQSTGYPSDPCYPSPMCCQSDSNSYDYSSAQNSNYNSKSNGGQQTYSSNNNVYPGSSGDSYKPYKRRK